MIEVKDINDKLSLNATKDPAEKTRRLTKLQSQDSIKLGTIDGQNLLLHNNNLDLE